MVHHFGGTGHRCRSPVCGSVGRRGDDPLETFTILTTAASPGLADIHHRQPSIIEADDFEEWLAPGAATDRLLALPRRAYEGPFDPYRVSRRVDYPRNDDPDLLAPLAA